MYWPLQFIQAMEHANVKWDNLNYKLTDIYENKQREICAAAQCAPQQNGEITRFAASFFPPMRKCIENLVDCNKYILLQQ